MRRREKWHHAGKPLREAKLDAISKAKLERKQASDFPQELLDLLDSYVHGAIGRREFMAGACKVATATLHAAALVGKLRAHYTSAVPLPGDGNRSQTHQG